MNLTGATLFKSKVILYSSDTVYTDQLLSAKSVLKIDDEVCYLNQGVVH